MYQAQESDELGVGGKEVEVEPPLPPPVLPWGDRISLWFFWGISLMGLNLMRRAIDSEMSLKTISMTLPRLGGIRFPFGFFGGLVAWLGISGTWKKK